MIVVMNHIIIMVTKYDFEINDKILKSNNKRLINQLWKLIPLREESKDWKKQLDNLIIEITGLNEIFKQDFNFLVLLSKLEGLRSIDNFETYRRTVFESISLLQEIYEQSKHDEDPT